jgi:hypothetical protein
VDISNLEQKAIDFARRGEFSAAAKQVNEELTKLVPSNQGAWTRLARCNIELGLFDEANNALETALQLNPQNTIARSLLQESIKRSIRLEAPEPAPKRKRTPSAGIKKTKAARPVAARGLGRAQFAALGQLEPSAAVESLTPAIEPVLTALNDRGFAEKVVEARNRAGHAGNVLFRRNTVQAGGNGHVYVFHYGGRWEPQLNVGLFSGEQWGRPAIRAGIGFNFTTAAAEGDVDTGPERVAEYFERFQQLVSAEWKQLLTKWMAANGGFIQYADGQPETSLMPADAVAWLLDTANPAEHGWIFVGRWLFGDRGTDSETMEDPTKLAKWMEQAFTDLLPLWMSVYRG